jgi:hypothetical protein
MGETVDIMRWEIYIWDGDAAAEVRDAGNRTMDKQPYHMYKPSVQYRST